MRWGRLKWITAFTGLTRREKIQVGFSYFLRATILAVLIRAALWQQWLVVFLSILALLVTFLPALIEKNFNLYIPSELEVVIILFTFSSLLLGEIGNYYARYPWWDLLLHSVAGLVFGFVGFLIVFILNQEKRVQIKLGPRFVALFTFTFAVTIGSLWEIFEFSIDQFFGLNMQKSGLVDTMWDLIVNALGASIAAFGGYGYIKKGKYFLFNNMLNNFIKENPSLFGDAKWLNSK